MTCLYALSLYPLLPDRWRELLPMLPTERQQRALACRADSDAARIAGAGWLLQQVLQQNGIPRDQQRFTCNPQGKPALAENKALHFSLSHSGSWVVCAVGDHPVGVDVELPRCSAAIAKRYFHPSEAAWADDPDCLCRLWTAKEAFVKALGDGLTIPLRSFQVELMTDRAVLFQAQSPLPYQLHEYALAPYRICLCSVGEKPELTLWNI